MKGKKDKQGKHISDLARSTENVAKQSSEDLILIIKEARILEIGVYQHNLAEGKYLQEKDPEIISFLETIQKQTKKGSSRREESRRPWRQSGRRHPKLTRSLLHLEMTEVRAHVS